MKGTAYNLETGMAGLGIRRDKRYGIAATLRLDALSGLSAVKEMAVGEHDCLYLLDDRADLWSYDWRIGDHKRLFPQGHGLFGSDTRLAASGPFLFAADPSGDSSLSAYHAGNGQTMWSWQGGHIEGSVFHPLAIAADARYVYVLSPLEIDTGGDEPAVPEGGSLGIYAFTHAGVLADTIRRPSLRQPVRAKLIHMKGAYFLTIAPDGTITMLDTIFAKATIMGRGREDVVRTLPARTYAGLACDRSGMLYIGDARGIEGDDEDDRFILSLGPDGEAAGAITSYRGQTSMLLTDVSDRLYALGGGEETTITLLHLQPQTLSMPETGVPEGLWLSKRFDSTESGTVWHKLTADAFVPEGTQLRVSYFCLDHERAVIAGEYRSVDDWIADPSIPYKEKLEGLATFWSPSIPNPKDALFMGAKGRYLWLKLEWNGTERHTPTVEKLRLYFPRETYLDYLPPVYQEDEESRDFLERYLSIFGTAFTELEEEIGDLSRYIDPYRATGEHLRWLATWIGLETDDYWTDEQVRSFILAAPELYRYRGTKRGIGAVIEMYTGVRPIIVEQFQTKAMRDHAELRNLTDALYGDNPYSFTVLLRPEQALNEKQRVVIEGLLEEQKPAYTEAKLVQLQPWMYLDLHTYLGINTVLTEPSLLMLGPERSMPNDTLIVEMGMEKRMDVHTRLELDSELE
ncbi:phage tail protein [Paenibacillus sp. LHD-117]|uniref:phage tail protein n=1 Tax=Paenibacillus sp. LHD-117 TaxID=3071412 RepID=UPI0027E0C2BF|nr:phage tail protein [Paenibacillus sp. LHD-117]MDQ6423030.1 phage tail protein [Paenibacillus sp. LHD-117]